MTAKVREIRAVAAGFILACGVAVIAGSHHVDASSSKPSAPHVAPIGTAQLPTAPNQP